MIFLNFFYFCGSVCPLESGYTDPIESGSSSDRICNRAFSRPLGYHTDKSAIRLFIISILHQVSSPIWAWMNIVIFLRIGMQIALQTYFKFKFTSLKESVCMCLFQFQKTQLYCRCRHTALYMHNICFCAADVDI